MRVVLFILALFIAPTVCMAADYKPGSAGYLHADCQRVLAESGNLADAHNSFCGAFTEGYFMGVTASSSLRLPEPNKDDPCFEDKTREYKRINERFCAALPTYNLKKDTPASMIHKIANMVELWAAQNTDKLNEPAAEVLGSFLQPGTFCDSLPAPEVDVAINLKLERLGWNEIFAVKGLVSHDGKYKRCVKEIEEFKDDPVGFRGTRCGAEVSGFIAGLYASDHLNGPTQTPKPECKKQIERLYNSVNPRETMCVKSSTHPLYVAKVFVENYELIRGNPGLLNGIDLFDPGALGAVGYETIYRGFMCRNEAEKKSRSGAGLTPPKF